MLELRSQCEMISLESDSGLASAAQAAKRLPHYFDTVKNYLSKSVFEPVLNLFDTNDSSWFTRGLNKRSYIELQDVEVACPMGFTGDLVSYSRDLLHAAKLSSEILPKNVLPFNDWIETRLSDPATLNAATSAKVPNYIDLKVESAWEKVNHYFSKAPKEMSTTRYKNIIKRNADWVEIVKNVAELDAILNKTLHTAVIANTNRLTGNLDNLLHRIEQDPATYKLTGQVIKTLAERSYDCAKSVEFYALIRFKRRELEVAMTDIKAKIESIV